MSEALAAIGSAVGSAGSALGKVRQLNRRPRIGLQASMSSKKQDKKFAKEGRRSTKSTVKSNRLYDKAMKATSKGKEKKAAKFMRKSEKALKGVTARIA